MARDVGRADGSSDRGAVLIARLDRIGGWPYKWSLFVPMGAGFLVAFFDIANIGFSLPGYRGAYHLSLSTGTLAISIGLWAYIVGSYLIGLLSQVRGRRIGFVVATGLFTLGSIGCTFTFNYASLIIWRAITAPASVPRSRSSVPTSGRSPPPWTGAGRPPSRGCSPCSAPGSRHSSRTW